MKRILSAIILSALLLSSLFSFGCENKKSEDELVIMLDWYINTNHGGLYVAYDKGYFKDEGFENVKFIEPGENIDVNGMITQGEAQFGISYQETVMFARTAENPQSVIAIAAILAHNTSAFASPVEKNIVSPKDFEGKIYGGYGSPVEEAMVKSMMRNAGADENSITFVNLGMGDFFSAVEGDIDLSMIYCGWTGLEAKERGMELNEIMIKDNDKNLDIYTPVIISSEQYLKDNPETAKKFLKAVEKGYEFCRENPQEAADILKKYAPETDETLMLKSLEYLSQYYKDEGQKFGYMEKDRWDGFYAFCIENDIMPEGFDVTKAFTNDYLPK